MTSDEFELLLMQYADDALAGAQREAVENRLIDDPGVRVLVADYRRLNEAMQRATPDHSIRWDALAARISAATVDADNRIARKRLILWRVAMVSMAACLILVVGIHLKPNHHTALSPLSVAHPAEITPVAQVTGPAIETPQGPTSAMVKIGPPPLTASAAEQYPFVQDVVRQNSHVSIGSPSAGDRQ